MQPLTIWRVCNHIVDFVGSSVSHLAGGDGQAQQERFVQRQ
jgi:hypothetical protein